MEGKNLNTAQELEEILGRTYFYRQSIYRMADDGKISSYLVNDKLFFSSEEVVSAALNRLAYRMHTRLLRHQTHSLRINFDEQNKKLIKVYGFSDGSTVWANTETETEEELLRKVEEKRREVKNMLDIPVGSHHDVPPPPPSHHPPRHGDEIPPHEEVLEVLRRIEDRLIRIEEKLE